MTIARWTPPVAPTRQEQFLLKRLDRVRKLLGFLRVQRHELFNDACQDELASMYRTTGAGKDALPPAMMAMAMLVQGYLGMSDAEMVELTVVDLRVQMVLGCLGTEASAFSQGALQEFRERLIAADLDRRLLERTVDLAKRSQAFDYRKLPKTLRVGTCYEPGGKRPIEPVPRPARGANFTPRSQGQKGEAAMEWVIQLECRLGDTVLHRRDMATISRASTPLLPEHVGLTLRDGKTVLNAIQRAVVTDQVEVEAAAWRICPHCQQRKRIKDRRQRRVRTTFGEVVVCCRRYHHCTCLGGRPRIEWPLRRALPARSTPEFAYLLATWGSRMPYRRAATLLRALLPLRRSDVSYGSVRRCTLDTGRRIENRAIDRDEYEWESTGRRPVTPAADVQVAIDGTWIRAAPGAYGRQLHVVAGRIARDGRLGGHFAWLPEAVGATGAMMRSALDDDGCTAHSQLEVIADGADGLESVVREAAERPPAQRLDWFHLSMRLRPIEQMVDRVATLIPDAERRRTFQHDAPRLRWQLWHGRWRDAIRRTHQLSRPLRTAAAASGPDRDRLQRFVRHLVGLRRYLRGNTHLLFHYAQTRRQGRRISTALAESGMNHLVNARMGKRQPMRWSAEGAHLLLQVRCALLDTRLDELFREWYPGWGTSPPTVALRPGVLAPPGS